MRQSLAGYFKRLSLIFLVSFFIVVPVWAQSTKVSNYQDFATWYTVKNKKSNLPFQAAAVITADSLEPLYYYQESTPIPTASLIKLVTAGTVVKLKPDWWQNMSFTEQDNETDLRTFVGPKDKFSLLKLKANDSISLEQSFASMLIGSANNSANHFSYVWGNDRPQFIELMRQTASNWGMSNTKIVEPSGLSLDNVSTAADLARAGCQAFSDFMIQHYSSKPSVTFTTALGEKKTVAHTVHVLRAYPNRFFGAKTGYLTETGYHLVAGFITPQKKKICVAILSSSTRAASENVLFDFGKWVDQMYKF